MNYVLYPKGREWKIEPHSIHNRNHSMLIENTTDVLTSADTNSYSRGRSKCPSFCVPSRWAEINLRNLVRQPFRLAAEAN